MKAKRLPLAIRGAAESLRVIVMEFSLILSFPVFLAIGFLFPPLREVIRPNERVPSLPDQKGE